jgi:hypothetical protein
MPQDKPKIKELTTSDELDRDKIEVCIAALEAVFQKHSLSVAELMLTYGNLGYKLGQNIGKQCYDREFSGPPDLDNLLKMYEQKPDLDVSLMLSSLQMIIWVDNLLNPKEEND